MTDKSALQKGSQMLIYQSEDGQTRIEVQLEAESVWLTQKQMADLFRTSKQNTGQHLKNIFAEGELDENSVVKKFFTTAADGKKYQIGVFGNWGSGKTFLMRLMRKIASCAVRELSFQ